MTLRPLIRLVCQLTVFGISIANAEPLRVGLLADISGVTARVGQDCQRGYELALANSISNEKSLSTVEAVYGDNQNDAKAGLSEFRHMIELKNIKAVVTTRSHIAMSFANTSRQEHIPVLGIVSHPRFIEGNPFAFRFIASARKEGEALANTVVSLGYKKIAVITLNDEAYIASSDAFKEAIAQKNSAKIISLDLNPDETDFKGLATRIKSQSPDAVYVNLGIAQLGSFIRKLKETGWNGQLLSNFLLAVQDVKKDLGDLIEGALYTESERGGHIFEGLYSKQYHIPPTQLSYACFVALSAIIQASSGSSKIETSEEMFNLLNKTKTVRVPDGEVRVVNREAEIQSTVYRIEGTSAKRVNDNVSRQ